MPQKTIFNALRKWTPFLAVSLVSISSALHAQLPALWPTFSQSQPTSVVNVNTYGTIASPADTLAEITFMGAYNQLQGSTRLYLSDVYPDDNWWLTQSIPSGVTVSNLSWNQSDPDGALKAMLAAYGPQGSNSVSKYIICDPANQPESCNMATTMAGINQAMVVTPDNLSLMSTYGMSLLTNGDLRTYLWIGSDSTLVNNTTINQVNNPSGGNGTTGWSNNCSSGQTLGTATFLGVTALKWTSAANEGTCWTLFNPTASLNRYYIFSMQVAGSGTVYLDAWNGVDDTKSSSVALNSSAWQTLQVAVAVPNSDNTHPVEIQIRANTASNAITAYFINAAVVREEMAIDTYQYNNLISSTSTSAVAILSPNTFNALRDYAIAAKMFTFYCSYSNADEKTLFDNIINHTGTFTPVFGWVQNEGADVGELSSSTDHDHFLNASNNYKNGSLWASFAGPSSLSQPAPAAIKATNGTVYVAWGMSDGDNIGFDQHRDQNAWTMNQFMGAVPVAWTTSPGFISFSPGILNYDYTFLPQSSEMMAGPGGVGYATNISNSTDLNTFAVDTRDYMNAEGMSSVTSWQNNTTSLVSTFTTDANVPHVVWKSTYPYTLDGNDVIDGQQIGYHSTTQDNISAVQTYVTNNYSAGSPLFIEMLADDATLSPDDMLYIAQQLQSQGPHPFYFMTPSEMALTEKAYHQGTCGSCPTSNAQAVAGSTLLSEFPQNEIQNGTGQNGIRISGGFTLGTTGHYESLVGYTILGVPAQQFRLGNSNVGSNVYISAPLTVPVANADYDISVNVIGGQGSVELGVYDGSAWHYSSPVTLNTTTWQTLDLFVKIKSLTAGQVQIIFPSQSTAAVAYFTVNNISLPFWSYVYEGSGVGNIHLSATPYNYTPSLEFTVPANEGQDEYVYQFPTTTPSTQYTFSVDVAGTGTAYLDANDGSADHNTATVTLGPTYQTLSETITTASSGSPIFAPKVKNSSSASTLYFRNPSVVAVSGTTDFYTGLESGQPGLTWTNTVDNTPPGGNITNVTSAVLDLTTSAMSRGGSNAIQYSGTATNGAHVYAYMKAVSNSTTLSSTSRLSYWVFPMGPKGQEPGASSTMGLNSTCVAIDIIFTDGTDLRDSGVTDQYGNQLHPAHECNHLIPDQWNYVTANLSTLSGKTISRIDVGYDQPNAPSGNYSGYVDDINIHH